MMQKNRMTSLDGMKAGKFVCLQMTDRAYDFRVLQMDTVWIDCLNFWTEGLRNMVQAGWQLCCCENVGSKPYSKKRIINFFIIFAQDCTAYNHLVELYRVLTSTVSYQKKNVFFIIYRLQLLGSYSDIVVTVIMLHIHVSVNMNEENCNFVWKYKDSFPKSTCTFVSESVKLIWASGSYFPQACLCHTNLTSPVI